MVTRETVVGLIKGMEGGAEITYEVMPILPAPLTSWYRAVEYARERFPALKVEANG